MRYGCKDIEHILENRDAIIEDESGFIDHIENCALCGRLANLTPELEEILAVSTPKSSPLSFEDDILAQILQFEKRQAKENRWEKALTPILILASAIPIFLVWRSWSVIKTFFGTLDMSGIVGRIGSIISQISMPKIDLTEIANSAANSPLFILGLISVTTILWAFSIIEARKALR